MRWRWRMNLPEFLTKDELGYIHFTGHRIGLLHVARMFREGSAPEMVFEEYPTLSLSVLASAFAYYNENKEAVDYYCAEEEKELDRLEAATPRKGPTLEELKRRS